MANTGRSEVKELSPVERELSIVISSENIKREMDLAYQRLSSRVKHKGFRPGKVPRPILEQYYKHDVEKDVLNKLLNKSYQEAVEEHSLFPIADPEIDAKKAFKPGSDFAFTAKVEIRPEVAIQKWEGLSISVPEFSVSDSDVDIQLEKLQDAHSTIVPEETRDSIVQGDLVECNYSCEVEGINVKELSGMNQTIEIGSNKFFTAAEQALIGKKASEKVSCTVTLPDTFQVESLRGKEASLLIVPSSIRVRKKPELDDEFAKDISDEFSSLDDLKKAILEKLNQNKEEREVEAKRTAALNALIENNPFELPKGLIRRQAEQQAMRVLSQLPKEQAQTLWAQHGEAMTKEAEPQAIKTIRATFLCDAIAKEQNINIEDADVDAEIAKEASRMNVSATKLKSYYKADDIDALKRRLAAEKALNIVIEKADITIQSGSKENDKSK